MTYVVPGLKEKYKTGHALTPWVAYVETVNQLAEMYFKIMLSDNYVRVITSQKTSFGGQGRSI